MAKPKGEPIDKGIGERIRKFRKLCNLTQKQMAEMINNTDENASATYISVNAWENGRTRISDRNLSAVSRAIWEKLKQTQYYFSGNDKQPEEINLFGIKEIPFSNDIFLSPEEISIYIKTGCINYSIGELSKKKEEYRNQLIDILLSLVDEHDKELNYKDEDFQWACTQIDNYYALFNYLVEEIRHGVIQIVECRGDLLDKTATDRKRAK